MTTLRQAKRAAGIALVSLASIFGRSEVTFGQHAPAEQRTRGETLPSLLPRPSPDRLSPNQTFPNQTFPSQPTPDRQQLHYHPQNSAALPPVPPPTHPPVQPTLTFKHAPPRRLPNPTGAPADPDAPLPLFVPWWQTAATSPLWPENAGIEVTLASLLYQTLQHSAQVHAISEYVRIAETGIVTAGAAFDPTLFMESRFARLNNPTGSTLDAGTNVTRLLQQDWINAGGLRKRNQWGGNWELSQGMGTRASNSQFFFPANQGNSTLTLGYTQPLLNGAGRGVNRSLIVLARLDSEVARSRTSLELQDYLLSVTEAHWELYQQRTWKLQKQVHLERVQIIARHLQERRTLDALESQIVQVRAAESIRAAELAQANTLVKNAEARLRSLVNAPEMLANREAELVTVEPPLCQPVEVHLPDALVTALEHRPEIDRVMREIESARVRLNVAKNELLPALDVVLESYVAGLRGNYDVAQSWNDQFSTGQPSYTAGLVFEVPLHRRAAHAQCQRRQSELRQLSSQMRALTEVIYAEVENALRDLETAKCVLDARQKSMIAAGVNAEYFQRRWELLPGDDRAATYLLQDLLDAQDRLTSEEEVFVKSQVAYVLSLTRLNRATGRLLEINAFE